MGSILTHVPTFRDTDRTRLGQVCQTDHRKNQPNRPFLSKFHFQTCTAEDDYLLIDKSDSAWNGIRYGPWTDVDAQTDFIITCNHMMRESKCYVRPRGMDTTLFL